MKNLVVKPLMQYFIIAGAACGLLTLAYFCFARPPWLAKGDNVWESFGLECSTIAILVLTFVIVARDPAFSASTSEKRVVDAADMKTLAAFGLLTFAYAIYRVRVGDSGPIRLMYAAFSMLVLFLWFRNARLLLHLRIASFAQRVASVSRSPQTVFEVGRPLASELTRVSLYAIILLVPMLTWLPTLLPGRFAPRTVGFSFAIAAIAVIILMPVYVRSVLSDALTKSFAGFDSKLAAELRESLENLMSKDVADRLKANFELRESIANSINVSASEIVTTLAQNLAILTALITIWFGRRP